MDYDTTVLKIKKSNKYLLENLNLFTNLSKLVCSRLNLEYLDLTLCPNLKSLDCSNNRLRKINTSLCTNLEYLKCNNNCLTQLNLIHNTKLEELYCNNNFLKQLTVNNCSFLTLLCCKNNRLTILYLNNCSQLKFLCCTINKLKKIFLNCFVKFFILLWRDIEFQTNVNIIRCQEYPLLENCENDIYTLGTKYLNLEYNSSYTKLDINRSNINLLNNLHQFSNLDILICNNVNLTFLDVNSLLNLRILDCSENNIKNLNVSQCCLLEKLYVNDNCLSELVINSVSLEIINMSCCYLTNINLISCPNLRYLDCGGNNLEVLDLKLYPKLSYLDCRYNRLEVLDINPCSNIKNINASYNYFLTSLFIDNCNYLEILDFSFTLIDKLVLNCHKFLIQLRCCRNRMQQLCLDNFINLQHLILTKYGGELLLSIDNCPKLKTLHLRPKRHFCVKKSIKNSDMNDTTVIE